DFSRLERQRPRLARARVGVAEVLARAAETLRNRCRDAGKELLAEPAAQARSFLETDAELLQQVLGNLIDNACKYSQDAADPPAWPSSVPWTTRTAHPGGAGRHCRHPAGTQAPPRRIDPSFLAG